MKKFRRLTSAVLSAALALTCLSAVPLSAGAVDLTNKTPDIMIGHPDDFPQSNLTEVKSLEESDCTNVAELDGYYQMVDDPSGMLSGDHAVLLFIENKEGNEAIAQIKENGLSIKFSFTPDENGEYVFSSWATDPRGENWQSLGLAETVAYYNAWSVEVDGQAYDMTSYNAYEFAGFYLVKAFGDGVQLSAGTAYNITMTYKWNSTYGNRIFSAFDCIKVYKNANEKNTVCVDYNNYKADGNLQKVGNNRHWGVPAGEFADETGNDSQQRHLSYTVNCEEDGIYAIDYIASRQTGAYADAYGTHSITITNSKNEVQEYSQTSLYKQRISNIPGVGEEGAQEPATAPCLGYLVTAYYTSDDVSNESVAAIVKSTKKNSTLVIESEDIYKFENSRYYYTDSNGTRKSIAVKGSTSVLYNYEILTDAEQYVPDNGSITLISNDGDTIYDVLLIEDYADYCIKSIDTTNNRLVVEAVDDASRVVLSMTDEKIRLFDSEGNKGMLADLVADNIISIPKNYEDKQFPVKYIYSAKTVSGKLTGSSDEGSYYAVNIGGAEYRGKECGDTYAKYNNSEITARFNFRGMIVFIDNAGGTLSGDFRYGYVIRARQIETEDGIDAYQLKMLDQDGSIYLLECDEKTRLDGDITNFETLASVFYDSDKNMTKRQPVRYKTTGNGTIRYIDLPGNNSIGTTNNCLLKRVDGLYLYKGTTRIFKRLMSGSEGEAILDDNAVILRVPPRESPRDYDDEEFEVVGAHQVPHDDYCTIQAYNTDTDALSMSMCVVYMNGGTSFSTSDQSMMIQKVKEIYDEDVGATYEITTLHNNTQSTYVMSEPSVLTDEKGSRLNIGDIIRVLTNKDGYVTTVELLYSKASGAGIVNGSNEIYGGGINADFRMSYGNPYKVQNGNIQLTYNVAESGDEYFRAGGAPVYVYDSSLSSGKVYQGSIGDIWETRYGYNNKVLIQQFQTGVSQIYVIK